MEGRVIINGTEYSTAEAAISAFDRGLLFGDCIFEVLVGFGSKVLELDAHLTRLFESSKRVGIEMPWTIDQLKFEVINLVEKQNYDKSYIRLVVTRGSGLDLAGTENMQPNKYLYCIKSESKAPHLYINGATLKICHSMTTHRGSNPKINNYSGSIVEIQKARAESYDDILWVNDQGEITESSTANIFFIGRDGDLLDITTPSSHSGLLIGTTRQRILQLLNDAKIRATDQILYADEIPRFDEAFLTSTVRGIIPISKIGKHNLSSSRASSVTRKIESLYLTWVETNLGFRPNWQTGQSLTESKEKEETRH